MEKPHLTPVFAITPQVQFFHQQPNFVPPEITWWACTNGLTKCVSSEAFQNIRSLLCVLVYILPQVCLHNREGRAHINMDPRLLPSLFCSRLEPVLLGQQS